MERGTYRVPGQVSAAKSHFSEWSGCSLEGEISATASARALQASKGALAPMASVWCICDHNLKLLTVPRGFGHARRQGLILAFRASSMRRQGFNQVINMSTRRPVTRQVSRIANLAFPPKASCRSSAHTESRPPCLGPWGSPRGHSPKSSVFCSLMGLGPSSS